MKITLPQVYNGLPLLPQVYNSLLLLPQGYNSLLLLPQVYNVITVGLLSQVYNHIYKYMIPSIYHAHHMTNFQSTNTPDINLERDLVPEFDIEGEILLGMETSNLDTELEESKDKMTLADRYKGVHKKIPDEKCTTHKNKITPDIRFKINLSTIVISALLFLMILAWFDFMQTTFFNWLNPIDDPLIIPPSSKLWYAILVSVVVIASVLLIYYYSRDFIT